MTRKLMIKLDLPPNPSRVLVRMMAARAIKFGALTAQDENELVSLGYVTRDEIKAAKP